MKDIKPSGLIRLAIDDLKKVEELSNTYRINMNSWHNNHNRKCEVCLAGAVIAMTLHGDPEKYLPPQTFPECANQLRALNYFRLGSIHSGLNVMEIQSPAICDWEMPDYETDPAKFKQSMLKMANYLETFDL